jgi:hypothetical protein
MRAAAALLAVLPLIVVAAAPGGDDDDDKPRATAPEAAGSGPVKLTASQQQAVGILIERPARLTAAPLIEAYGTVLDPVSLVTDAGHLESTRAQAAASAAERARLERLYHDDAQASLKSLQAAQAQATEAAAQARAAQLNFSMQWGPLAAWSDARRAALLDAVSDGRVLLVRADLPAHAAGGALAPEALVEVQGAAVSARVLGPLPRTDAQTQSNGWLLELARAPAGFGPGARAPVRLRAATAAGGLLVPAAALVYAAEGTYVYRQARGAGAAGEFSYSAVQVRPVTRVGAAWLVEGLDAADQVVVQGAGVLWSLQGIGSFSAAEEEHD